MSQAATAQTAYSQATRISPSSRRIEFDAFSSVTSSLKAAKAFEDTALAVHKNTKLWSVLAKDLAHDENELPDQLRAGLLNLAIFSEAHGQAVLRGQKDVEPLIEVNHSVMRGLMKRGAEQ